jgi:branched-chain amino acid transport system substrate-binding protein
LEYRYGGYLMNRYVTALFLLVSATALLIACNGQEATPSAQQRLSPELVEATQAPTEEPTRASAAKPTVTLTEEPTEEPTEMPVSNCEVGFEGETITVYQQAGLTGPLARFHDDGFVNGTKDAVSAINNSGGVCGAALELRLEDTEHDPKQELDVYEQYRAEEPTEHLRAMFILTHGDEATAILRERVIEDEIVNITTGLDAETLYLPRDGWTVGLAPTYSDQFAGFIKWVSDNWDDIKPEDAGNKIVVGVIGWDNAFGASATSNESLAFANELDVTVLPFKRQGISRTADITRQIRSLLRDDANVIYVQSRSFGPAQVIGTIHALGAWGSTIVGGTNWAMNTETVNLLGQNATLMDGFYGVFPYLWWNDTDEAGVQDALASFEASGYPESDKSAGYLLSYGSVFALRNILVHAIDTVGYENLDGKAFFDAMKDLGSISANGLFELNVEGDNRAPSMAQIRQAKLRSDGTIEFVVVQDFFELPDTRPAAE